MNLLNAGARLLWGVFLPFSLWTCSVPETGKGNVSDTASGMYDSSGNPPKNIPSEKLICVDDYPITDEMLWEGYEDKEEKHSGSIYSSYHEKVWFTNDSLGETIVFNLYTDLFRGRVYHFFNDNIPNSLLDKIELSNEVGKEANLKEKIKYFSGLLTGNHIIPESFFTSKKGFKLGDAKEKAIDVYGSPAECVTVEGVEECYWEFKGDQTHIASNADENVRVARNSFGHEVRMFFSDGELVAMMLSNTIPG